MSRVSVSCVPVPLTSQLLGVRGEVNIGKPKWLAKHSFVNVQGLSGIDHNALQRKLGKLPPRAVERSQRRDSRSLGPVNWNPRPPVWRLLNNVAETRI